MIKFNYIIGANIELEVEAKYYSGTGETATEPGDPAEFEIQSVTCNDLEVETEDIYIKNIYGAMEPLDDLLIAAAWETL